MQLSGRLFIDQDNDNGEFELENETGIVNISQLLDGIYSSQNKLIYVEIIKDGSILFQEDGGLTKKIDKDGINSFHICGMNLDLVLFNNTGEYLDITIQERKSKVYGKIL